MARRLMAALFALLLALSAASTALADNTGYEGQPGNQSNGGGGNGNSGYEGHPGNQSNGG
jgi:Spy/CpxP family protein refolding chaperone